MKVPQRYEAAVPIDQLIEHPDNPRLGDEAAINDSMEAHGFYGAVVAQEGTGVIIAGNHRTRVARRRGEDTLPVLWLGVNDDEARRLMLVDNRSNDLASYENQSLIALLSELERSERGLIGTGYDRDDLDLLRTIADHGVEGNGDGGGGGPQLGDMTYRVVVDCDDEDDQASLIEEFTERGLSVRAVIN